MRLVTELYGAGLDADRSSWSPRPAPDLLGALADDDLVASLLIVHGLHPDDLDARVERALDSVRPFLRHHGGDVELLDVDEDAGAVRLRLLGSCDGCPSSSVTLQLAVERAIRDAAPEIVRHRRRRPRPGRRARRRAGRRRRARRPRPQAGLRRRARAEVARRP